jgi:hypothetical protein
MNALLDFIDVAAFARESARTTRAPKPSIRFADGSEAGAHLF